MKYKEQVEVPTLFRFDGVNMSSTEFDLEGDALGWSFLLKIVLPTSSPPQRVEVGDITE